MSTSPWERPPWEDDEDDIGLDEDHSQADDDETFYARGRLPGRTYVSKTFPVSGERSRDHGQPARFICKVFDNDEERSLTLEGDEWVVRESGAGRVQIKLLVAREAGRVKSIWLQRVPGPGVNGKVQTRIFLNRENSATLIELLRNLDHIPVEGETSIRVDDSLVRDIFASPSSLIAIYQSDPARFRKLISDDSSARDLIAVSHRREQLDRFKRLLADEEFFSQESSRYAREEDVWQKFFEVNPWILGVSLTGQLLTGWSTEKLEQVVAGSSITGVGKRTDALLRTAGRIRSMVFAEFKTHQTRLLNDRYYRSGCWAPSKDLAGGVAQVQGTINRAVDDIRERVAEQAPDGTEIPGEFTYLIKPRSFLVIGMLNEFVGERGGHHMDRFRSFELYRRNLVEPEVVTFDELLAKAEFLVETADAES